MNALVFKMCTIFVMLLQCKYKCRKICEVVKKFFDVLIKRRYKSFEGLVINGTDNKGFDSPPSIKLL